MYDFGMTADVSVALKFTGHGWADILFKFGPKSFTVHGVSDTTDVLGDLLRAALMLATGAWTARASFDGEPMETRLIAGNVWDAYQWREGFWVRVFEFPDIYQHLPDEQGHLSFEIACDKRRFTEAVLQAARQFQSENGGDIYEWGNNPFPLRALRALEAALTVTDPPLPPPPPDVEVLTIYRSE